MKTSHLLQLVLIALLIAGCSSVPTFHDGPDKNLHVAVNLKDPDSKIRADLDIYAEVDRCHDKRIGSVELNKPVVDIGLPLEKKLHLTYVITRNSYAEGRRSLNFLSTLEARPGYQYFVEFSWVDGIYNLEVFEAKSRKGARHRIPLNPATGC